jgi:hypothetical protein
MNEVVIWTTFHLAAQIAFSGNINLKFSKTVTFYVPPWQK